MNQYFVVKPTDNHRYKIVPGFKQENESHGYPTYRAARAAANYCGGHVVKHYTEEDYNRDNPQEAT